MKNSEQTTAPLPKLPNFDMNNFSLARHARYTLQTSKAMKSFVIIESPVGSEELNEKLLSNIKQYYEDIDIIIEQKSNAIHKISSWHIDLSQRPSIAPLNPPAREARIISEISELIKYTKSEYYDIKNKHISKRIIYLARHFKEFDLAVKTLDQNNEKWAYIDPSKYDFDEKITNEFYIRNGNCHYISKTSFLLDLLDLEEFIEKCENARLAIEEDERQEKLKYREVTKVRGRFIDGEGRTVVRKLHSQAGTNSDTNSGDEVSERTDYNDSASRSHSDGWFYED